MHIHEDGSMIERPYRISTTVGLTGSELFQAVKDFVEKEAKKKSIKIPRMDEHGFSFDKYNPEQMATLTIYTDLKIVDNRYEKRTT